MKERGCFCCTVAKDIFYAIFWLGVMGVFHARRGAAVAPLTFCRPKLRQRHVNQANRLRGRVSMCSAYLATHPMRIPLLRTRLIMFLGHCRIS